MVEIKLTINDNGIVKADVSGDADTCSELEIEDYMVPVVDALQKYIIRKDEYGDSWKLPDFPHLEALMNALVCLVKSKRVCHMLEKNKEKDYKQLLINSVDLMNYTNFLIQSVKK